MLVTTALFFSSFSCGKVEGGGNSSQVTPSLEDVFKEKNVVILDVRTPEEFAKGHVPGAVNLPVSDVASKVEATIPNKNTPVVVHCAAGARSARAVSTMEKLGFSKLVDGKTPETVAKAKGVTLTN